MSEIGPFPYKHTPLSPDSSKREPYLSLDQNRFPPLTYSEYREIDPTLYFCTTEDRNANSSQWIIKKCSTAQWLTSMHLTSLLKDLIFDYLQFIYSFCLSSAIPRKPRNKEWKSSKSRLHRFLTYQFISLNLNDSTYSGRKNIHA